MKLALSWKHNTGLSYQEYKPESYRQNINFRNIALESWLQKYRPPQYMTKILASGIQFSATQALTIGFKNVDFKHIDVEYWLQEYRFQP